MRSERWRDYTVGGSGSMCGSLLQQFSVESTVDDLFVRFHDSVVADGCDAQCTKGGKLRGTIGESRKVGWGIGAVSEDKLLEVQREGVLELRD